MNRYCVKWQKGDDEPLIMNDNDGDGYSQDVALRILRAMVDEFADHRYIYEDDATIRRLTSTWGGLLVGWYIGEGFYNEECEPIYLNGGDRFDDGRNRGWIEPM